MIIKPKEQARLIDLLLEEFKTASRTTIKKMIQHGSVTVNGKVVTNPVLEVKPDDTVAYVKHKMTANTQGSPVPVLFEDDYIVFVEKPAGLLTYGEKGTAGTSLYKLMLDWLQERSKGKERIYVVHRLDKEVSGIVLFAKSEEIQEKIKENWRETEKLYYALVEGKPASDEGTITSWLKETSTQKVYVTRQAPDAKQAITHYKILREYPKHTFLEIKIDTGRKNQIRVQLAEIGCPIVGDRKYGSKDRYKRQIRLHAFHFVFHHPVTKELIKVETLIPKSFLKLNERDEKYK
jgi:23S rRNA pseudouridine1911/1915/1917 synthase